MQTADSQVPSFHVSGCAVCRPLTINLPFLITKLTDQNPSNSLSPVSFSFSFFHRSLRTENSV